MKVITDDNHVFHGLDERAGGYYINRKKCFTGNKFVKKAFVEKAFLYAYQMTFGQAGHHRDHRSGGSFKRTSSDIFLDALHGKIAEYAFWQYITENFGDHVTCTEPDVRVFGAGQWDSGDLQYTNHNYNQRHHTSRVFHVGVKSTKSFGNVLFLETKDWDANGCYIPDGTKSAATDLFVLVRVNSNDIDKYRKVNLEQIPEMSLRQLILNINWAYDIAGYITQNDLRQIVRNKLMIPKNGLLNGRIRMDAANYFVQAGDLRPIEGV